MALVNNMFDFKESKISVIGSKESPYFFASQIATLLGYANTVDAVNSHVWDKYKITLGEFREKFPNNKIDPKYKNHTKLITEIGVYQLVFRSNLPIAQSFQEWTYNLIAELRKAGQLPKANQLVLINEEDLHKRVVKFLSNYYVNQKQVLFTATLGELQDSPEKRINANLMGYRKGSPDLLIFNSATIPKEGAYKGFGIEFKTPNGQGVLSDAQKETHKHFKKNGWKILVSNSYDECLQEIINYMSHVRIVCDHCDGRFCNDKSYANHLKYIHRIKK